MRRIYITFSGSAYDGTTQRIVDGAQRFGLERPWVYDDRYLVSTAFGHSPDFQWLLYGHRGPGNDAGRRGFGFFAWKPYIIADALSRLNDGDIVMFTDADTYPIADISVLYRECDRIGGTMLFSAIGCWHAHWCKRDCFIRMGMDDWKWRDRQHAVARFMLFQRGAAGVDNFLAEWQHYCLDPVATTFDPSQLALEYPELHEHRCEQAIFTNLAHKYGHKLYREACQFGANSPEDQELYPQLFEQDGSHGPKTLEGSRYFYVPGVAR